MILPRITIVTPNLNQAFFLETTLLSVFGQNYPDLEYIVMDGGSTDGSIDIIGRYSSRLTFFESANDAGQADAIHHGFSIASGEILCWLNSDDFLFPGALLEVGKFFSKNPHVDCLIGSSLIVDETGHVKRSGRGWPIFYLGRDVSYSDMIALEKMPFQQPAAFWRKSAYIKVGGIEKTYSMAFDFDLFLKMAREKPFSHTRSFLACFRVHGKSRSAREMQTSLADVREILRAQKSIFHLPWGRIRSLVKRRENRLRKRWAHLLLRTGRLHIPQVPKWTRDVIT